MSTPFIANNLIDHLQNRYPLVDVNRSDDIPDKSAILVLGGGQKTNREYGNQANVSDVTLQRINYAAFLHQKLSLPVIVSGGKNIGDVDTVADLMEKNLQEQHQIPVLFKEIKSMNTADESHYLDPLLKSNHINHVYLVTNAWHMVRSVYIFKCAGINVTPAPMGYYDYGPGYALISFLPNIDAYYVSNIALHEYIGLVWYGLKYGAQCQTKIDKPAAEKLHT